MKIIIAEKPYAILETIGGQTRGGEFSGFGFCKQEGEDLLMYDFVPLAWGDPAYTEIPTKKVYELSQREDASDMKVWVHKHPVGNGVPGPQNWSGTDNTTIETNPMGTLPSLIPWCASIVRTPSGWVGRVDTYGEGEKRQTHHLEVETPVDEEEVFDTCVTLKEEWTKRAAEERAKTVSQNTSYGGEWWGGRYGPQSKKTGGNGRAGSTNGISDEDAVEVLKKYLSGATCNWQEKQKITTLSGIPWAMLPDAKKCIEEHTPVRSDALTEKQRDELASYYIIKDLLIRMEDDLEFENMWNEKMYEGVEALVGKFLSGAVVTTEDRNNLLVAVGAYEYDHLLAERELVIAERPTPTVPAMDRKKALVLSKWRKK